MIGDWPALCRYLRLTGDDIEQLSYRYAGVRERCYHSLMTWTDIADSEGRQLNVTALLQALRRSDSHQLAGMSDRLTA